MSKLSDNKALPASGDQDVQSLIKAADLGLQPGYTSPAAVAPNFQIIVDAMEAPFFLVDGSGALLFANRQARDGVLLEYAQSESCAPSLASIFSYQQGKDLLHLVQEVLATNVSAAYALELPSPIHGKRWFELRIVPVSLEPQAQVGLFFKDVTENKCHQEGRKAQLYLLENSKCWSMPQLLQATLDKVGELTGSPIGFYHFVNEAEGTLSLQMWSTATLANFCRIGGKSGAAYPIEEGGVWLDCLRQRQTVIHNNYAELPHKRGVPEGHVPVIRELVTPIFRDQEIVAILGVGNKNCAYTEDDAALVQHFADMAWDLVAHKRIAEEQNEARRKLNDLISNLPGMAFSSETNDERTLHFVSEGCFKLTGYSAEELLSADHGVFAELIHPLDLAKVHEIVRVAMGSRQPYEVEYRLRAADGQERIVLERGVTVTCEGCDPGLIEGFAIDVTDQKNTAERIADSQKQLLTILDSIEAQIFVADMASHEVLFVNQKKKEAFGGNWQSEPCYRVFQNKEAPCEFCTHKQLLDSQGEPGPVCQWESCNPVNGRWYVNYDKAVRWLDGRMVHMQVAFDNTDRKESELKLRRMQKMEAMGLLASGVAHDFNNILSVILGYATMALDEIGESGSRIRRDVLQIQKAGLRARDLVKQILSFCHQSEEHYKPLKLHLIVKEVIKMLRSSLPSTIHVTAQLTGVENLVLANPSQIHQVLMNLCTNAHHAMKEGGELVIGLDQVMIDERQTQQELHDLTEGSYLRLSVKDTGSGIPQEILDKIFDPFFTTKDEGEGTGLGLAVVQGIIAAHKGAITVKSRPGEGTTVAVYLPEVLHRRVEEDGDALAEIPGGKEKILIVDDESAVALVIGRMLSSLGYATEIFTDSAKALEAYARNSKKIDLVITDMTMPKFTGMALAQAMRALRPDQPIIICTGYSEHLTAVEAKAKGIRAFLDKPVSQVTLALAVRRALDEAEEQPGDALATAG
ncbi:MAG: ATP-binding protein [Desulfobulbus sp.]|nr:ATP-binding protein [Desulfobulbus sp.]